MEESDTTVFSVGDFDGNCRKCGLKLPPGQSRCPVDGSASAEDLHPGSLLCNRYEIIEFISSGGMGAIYKARHLELGKLYAIKFLRLDKGAGLLERFQLEAKAVTLIDHPNVVQVTDFGTSEAGLPFMVMELLDGIPLSRRLSDGRSIPPREALGIFSQIAEGMARAHKMGVLHRDLKPANIMLVKDSEGKAAVKILDFGLAKIMQTETGVTAGLTKTGEIFGSPLYMSPEQGLAGAVDHRSDIYSIGCLIFEVLTGAPPFRADSAIATLMLHQTAPAPTLKEASLGGDFDPRLEAIVARCLAKSPDDRYQSMQELNHDIRELGSSSLIPNMISAMPEKEAAASRPPGAAKLPPAVAVAGAAALVSLAVLLGALFWSSLGQKTQMEKSQSMPDPNKPITAFEATEQDSAIKAIISRTRDGNYNLESANVSHKAWRDLALVQPHKRRLSVNLSESNIADDDLQTLERLPITQLKLEATAVSDAGLEHIAKIKTLKLLDLTNTKITDRGLSRLSLMPSLRDINLRFDQLDGSGLTGLPSPAQLKNLYLARAPLKPAFFERLSELTGLRRLDLSSTRADDGLVKSLVNLKKLYWLNLSGNKISDRSLDYLSRLDSLKELDLSENNLSLAALQKLKRLPELHRLIIDTGDRLDARDLAQLKRTLKNCLVITGKDAEGLGY